MCSVGVLFCCNYCTVPLFCFLVKKSCNFFRILSICTNIMTFFRSTLTIVVISCIGLYRAKMGHRAICGTKGRLASPFSYCFFFWAICAAWSSSLSTFGLSAKAIFARYSPSLFFTTIGMLPSCCSTCSAFSDNRR